MSVEAYSVSQVLALAKEVVERGLGFLWVAGEMSGFKRHQASGHLYFEMKDGRGRIACVQWREKARRLRFEPRDGMQVRAYGRLGIYEAQGRLQLYVEALEPAGLGELQAALERLKARLGAEGLFETARKRPVPAFPMRIGVVTSSSGAAVRDMMRVLAERWPVAEVVLRPCAVQGDGAAAQIVRALRDVQRVPALDLILLGRGGGSIEDLWCFNEEAVVRAVATSAVPIVTGIGHEIDVTLADFAADVRAATPSQAAELAVPSQADVRRRLDGQAVRLGRHVESRMRIARLRLARLEGSHGLRRPLELVRQRTQRVDDLSGRLAQAALQDWLRKRQVLRDLSLRWSARDPRVRFRQGRQRLGEMRERIDSALERRMREARERLLARERHLEAVGPHAVLSRGYAICLRSDGRAVRDGADVAEGDRVDVILERGALDCRVEGSRQSWSRADEREEERR